MSGYLLVRSNGNLFGLPLDDVIEVVDGAISFLVPGVIRSVRGAARIRGKTMTVVHLAALLTGEPVPDDPSPTVVVARCANCRIALEVDDADEVVRGDILPVPPGGRYPWATGIAERDDALVPVVDLKSLGERLAPNVAEGSP